jgi:hypothetical protein
MHRLGKKATVIHQQALDIPLASWAPGMHAVRRHTGLGARPLQCRSPPGPPWVSEGPRPYLSSHSPKQAQPQ